MAEGLANADFEWSNGVSKFTLVDGKAREEKRG
jgi:hypothetical protein